MSWYERYGRRIEDSRLPKEAAKRNAYAQNGGVDGFAVLDALDDNQALAGLRDLPLVGTLRRTWQRHFERQAPETIGAGQPLVRFKADRESPKTAEGLESPYDVEARYRHKRDTQWTGYMVHIAETCESDEPNLRTHVHTTLAAVHEARCTDDIEQALADKALTPGELFVDSADVSAELLVKAARSTALPCEVQPART